MAIATGFAIQAVLILTGTLVARMLGPDGRGYLAALILWPWVITLFGNLGIPSALTYSIAREPSASRTLARWGLGFALPQALLLIGLQALWLLLILHGDPAPVRAAGWLTLGLVPALLAQQYGLGLLQGHLRLRHLQRVAPRCHGRSTRLASACCSSWERTRSVRSSPCLLAAFLISGTTCLDPRAASSPAGAELLRSTGGFCSRSGCGAFCPASRLSTCFAPTRWCWRCFSHPRIWGSTSSAWPSRTCRTSLPRASAWSPSPGSPRDRSRATPAGRCGPWSG